MKRTNRVPMILCRDRLEISQGLREIRRALGFTGGDVDQRAGFCEGYTSKLENPFSLGRKGDPKGRSSSGRCAMHPMMDLWLGALGVGVIIVPLETVFESPRVWKRQEATQLVLALDDPPKKQHPSCVNKQAYDTHQGATEAMEKRGYRFDVYKCVHCAKFHMTRLEGAYEGLPPAVAVPKSKRAKTEPQHDTSAQRRALGFGRFLVAA